MKRRMAKLAALTGILSMPIYAQATRAQDTAPNAVSVQQEFAEILKQGDLDQAKAFVASKAEADPKSNDVLTLRQRLASMMLQKGDNQGAQEQMQQVIAVRMEQIDQPGAAMQLVGALTMTDSIMRRAGNEDGASDLIEQVSTVLTKKAAGDKVTPFHQALAQLIRMKAQKLSMAGKENEALALLEGSLAEAEKLFAGDQDSSEAASNVVAAYQGLLMQVEGERQRDLFQKMKAFTELQMKAKPDNIPLLSGYLTGFNVYANRIFRDDPYYVEKLLEDVKLFVQTAKDANADAAPQIDNLSKMLDRLGGSVESAKKLIELIGKPAPKIDAEYWVRTEPATQDELKGKVVLLDFWAVWCGPCIATFPHLKHLDQEYGPQGLKILGVTRKYNYSWNEEAKRAVRAEDEVSIEDELSMLDKFMASHELTHGTIVSPEMSEMQKEYGVTGIPHAVLIDKSGNVRLIKVGSTEKNAQEIEAMIQKLIAE